MHSRLVGSNWSNRNRITLAQQTFVWNSPNYSNRSALNRNAFTNFENHTDWRTDTIIPVWIHCVYFYKKWINAKHEAIRNASEVDYIDACEHVCQFFPLLITVLVSSSNRNSPNLPLYYSIAANLSYLGDSEQGDISIMMTREIKSSLA